MNTFIGVIVGIVGLGFLILVHELGHFMVAKATGMRVEEFSIGFGRYLVKRRWGETVYGISMVPLGGYVRVTGMHEEEFEQRLADLREQEAEDAARALVTGRIDAADGAADGERSKKKRRPRDPEDALAGKRALSAAEIAATPLERRYYAHPLWHKLLFIVAGVAMNFIVAFIILYGIAVGSGGETVITSTYLGEIADGSAAEASGLRVDDRIVSVDGKDVADWEDMRFQIALNAGETVTIVIERAGEEIAVEGVQIQERDDGTGVLGVGARDTEYREIGWLGGFEYAGRTTGEVVALIFRSIGWMFSGEVPVTGPQGLAGPVGIVQLSSDFVERGAVDYLGFLAFISINLGLLNMLPLLPLDGGHVVVNIVEKIRRRRVSLRMFERVSLVGFALVLLLLVVALYNDAFRIFGST